MLRRELYPTSSKLRLMPAFVIGMNLVAAISVLAVGLVVYGLGRHHAFDAAGAILALRWHQAG